jgi:hypothetical protein
MASDFISLFSPACSEWVVSANAHCTFAALPGKQNWRQIRLLTFVSDGAIVCAFPCPGTLGIYNY